ncbi:hypothetical protein L510_4317 [Bordetella bronchiseptica MBORD591]|nr:hypothetical protein L510_4317 [Bordetella bronchiseptica MBORD591]
MLKTPQPHGSRGFVFGGYAQAAVSAAGTTAAARGACPRRGTGTRRHPHLLTNCLQRVSVPVRGQTPAVESCLGVAPANRDSTGCETGKAFRMPQAWQRKAEAMSGRGRGDADEVLLAWPCRALSGALPTHDGNSSKARESSSIRSEPPSTALNRTPSTNNNAGRGGRASCGKIAVNLFDGAVIVSDPQTLQPGGAPDLRTLTHVAYGLYALGFLTGGFLGIATLAAVVLMYVKRGDTAGTMYASHFDWLLRTFWWALLWLAISAIATLIFIGWIGVVATVVWVLYRLIKGWLALLEGNAPSSYT